MSCGTLRQNGHRKGIEIARRVVVGADG